MLCKRGRLWGRILRGAFGTSTSALEQSGGTTEEGKWQSSKGALDTPGSPLGLGSGLRGCARLEVLLRAAVETVEDVGSTGKVVLLVNVLLVVTIVCGGFTVFPAQGLQVVTFDTATSALGQSGGTTEASKCKDSEGALGTPGSPRGLGSGWRGCARLEVLLRAVNTVGSVGSTGKVVLLVNVLLVVTVCGGFTVFSAQGLQVVTVATLTSALE